MVTEMKRVMTERKVEYAWTRVHSLPRRASSSGDEARPHQVTTYSTFMSCLKVLYVFIDNWVGSLKRVGPMKRAGTLLLVDRGWWDMAVDQRRYRLKNSAWLVRLLGRFAPRPDLVVILQAPPATILQRKAELDAGELQRQMEVWRNVLPSRVPRELLDVDRPFGQVAGDLRLLLEKVLEQER